MYLLKLTDAEFRELKDALASDHVLYRAHRSQRPASWTDARVSLTELTIDKEPMPFWHPDRFLTLFAWKAGIYLPVLKLPAVGNNVEDRHMLAALFERFQVNRVKIVQSLEPMGGGSALVEFKCGDINSFTIQTYDELASVVGEWLTEAS